MTALDYLLIGVVTGWPPAAAGMWLTWWLARRSVQRVTDRQTREIRAMTAAQTSILLAPGQPPAPPVSGS
jgi:hypothetical protein